MNFCLLYPQIWEIWHYSTWNNAYNILANPVEIKYLSGFARLPLLHINTGGRKRKAGSYNSSLQSSLLKLLNIVVGTLWFVVRRNNHVMHIKIG